MRWISILFQNKYFAYFFAIASIVLPLLGLLIPKSFLYFVLTYSLVGVLYGSTIILSFLFVLILAPVAILIGFVFCKLALKCNSEFSIEDQRSIVAGTLFGLIIAVSTSGASSHQYKIFVVSFLFLIGLFSTILSGRKAYLGRFFSAAGLVFSLLSLIALIPPVKNLLNNMGYLYT